MVRKKILITGGLGYIGIPLVCFLSMNTDYDIDVVCSNWYKGPLSILDKQRYYNVNYNTLDHADLYSYDAIVHLAAHSSVQAVESDITGALKNNCIDFINFINKTNYPKTKVIYASSGSVYGQSGEIPCKETNELKPPIENYDYQKQFNDRWVETQLDKRKIYGLRFGTVNGYSLNPRNELMVNSMVKAAKTDGIVKVTNSDSFRAILGLNDLCRAVYAIIEQEGPSGFYNLSSFNMSIGDIGKEVSNVFKCNLVSKKGHDRYSFSLDTTKFQETFNFNFEDTIESIALAAAYNDFTKVRTWQEMKQ